MSDWLEFTFHGVHVRVPAGSPTAKNVMVRAESFGAEVTADTERGDAVATMFDWTGWRVLIVEAAYPSEELFIAVDDQTRRAVAARDLAHSDAEVEAWAQRHLFGSDQVPTRGGMLDDEDCPACSPGLISMITSGPLVGYGHCGDCGWSEVGQLVPGYTEPLRMSWPVNVKIEADMFDDRRWMAVAVGDRFVHVEGYTWQWVEEELFQLAISEGLLIDS